MQFPSSCISVIYRKFSTYLQIVSVYETCTYFDVITNTDLFVLSIKMSCINTHVACAVKISSVVSPADDGKLSLDEFQAFFSDGTLNEEELEKLFHTIDSDNTR